MTYLGFLFTMCDHSENGRTMVWGFSERQRWRKREVSGERCWQTLVFRHNDGYVTTLVEREG